MSQASVDDWNRRPNGEIETAPVVGWSVAAFPLNVMLRLEILAENGQTEWAQVHIPAHRAPDLAKAIQRSARRALATGRQRPAS